MHYDALTLACVAAELNQTVCHGRVQQVVMADEHSVGLEIYAQHERRYLLLSAQADAGRVHLMREKLRRGTERQPPLLLLLRKYVRGSAVAAVEQPDPTERVLRFVFDHPEHGASTLVAELIGRASNLLLVAPDNRILDCLHRIRPRESGRRTLLPGQSYTPPPLQSKLPPVDDGSADYYERLTSLMQTEETEEKLWRILVTGVAGTSPTLAREIAWRVGGDADMAAEAADTLAVAQALQHVWAPVETGAWQPGTFLEENTVAGFAAYSVQFRGEFVPVDSISFALEQFYAQKAIERRMRTDAYAALRGTVAGQLDTARKRVQRRLEALDQDEPRPGEIDRLRAEAEWLLALSSQIQPGQTVLEVDLGEKTLTITLDTRRTPVEQAQRMFARATKLERAERFIPKRRRQVIADAKFLEQLQIDLDLAENQPEIAAVGDEIRAMGLLPHAQANRSSAGRAGDAASTPRSYESAGGFEILVGRNARQNEIVTFKMAHPEDNWLHVRDAPGSHVIIRRRGETVDEDTIYTAAQLAAFYSKRRGERSAEVAMTQKRFVSRISGGRKGQVSVRRSETVTVPADMPGAGALKG